MKSSKIRKYCRQAILDTLSYRAVFNYPLSFYQLGTLLVTGKPVTLELLSSELKDLIKSKRVGQRSDKYFLAGTSPVDWLSRKENTDRMLQRLSGVFRLLGYIPWVKLVGVTGTLAAGNASDKDDVDVFIVAARGRVWLARFFVVLLLKLCGVYRTDVYPQGKVCPNIFVDESSISWPNEKRNIYIAHEILLMRPVVDKDNAYFGFLHSNGWVFDYFKNTCVYDVLSVVPKEPESVLVNLTERLLMRLQLWYMRNKRTIEITNERLIHFNREDNTKRIIDGFESFKRSAAARAKTPDLRRRMRRPRFS